MAGVVQRLFFTYLSSENGDGATHLSLEHDWSGNAMRQLSL
jgi:hypothetical protein